MTRRDHHDNERAPRIAAVDTNQPGNNSINQFARPHRAFPGGEDFAAVVRRVREGLRTLAAAAPSRRIALVTHRMPIAAAAALSEAGGAAVPASVCPNGSITTLESEDGERWRLVAWGDARGQDG